MSLTWVNLERSFGPVISLSPGRATIDRHEFGHRVAVLVIDSSVDQCSCCRMYKEQFQQEKECEEVAKE